MSSRPKAAKYLEINTFVLWFYVLSTLGIKIFLNTTHVTSKLLAILYITLKSYGILLASFTLLYRHLSYFASLKQILPEFKGMRKFLALNTMKFLMISLTVFMRLLPKRKVTNHEE